jgi:hypothetical protein
LLQRAAAEDFDEEEQEALEAENEAEEELYDQVRLGVVRRCRSCCCCCCCCWWCCIGGLVHGGAAILSLLV